MKFDLHFHTTLSDGQKTSREAIIIAKEKGLEFLACTEHDLINTEIQEFGKEYGIETIQGVELSSSDYKNNQKGAHLTCYSHQFQGRVFDILSAIRSARAIKIERQIDKLSTYGFYIDPESFFSYWQKLGANSENLNNGHIREYLFLDPRNEQVVFNLSGKPYDRPSFITEFLSKTGKFSYIGAIDNLPAYEPSVELCGELARENNAVLSIAHPNHTFSSIEEFQLLAPQYVERGVNALEIHHSTPPEWIDILIKTKEKYNLLVTFGSDCHFDSHSYKHGMIGDLNPHVSDEYIQKEFSCFQEALVG